MMIRAYLIDGKRRMRMIDIEVPWKWLLWTSIWNDEDKKFKNIFMNAEIGKEVGFSGIEFYLSTLTDIAVYREIER